MSAPFSCYLCFLVVLVLSNSCISNQILDNVLCKEGERQALLQFKHGLIDEPGRLVSWVGEDKNCCKWVGIVCDNITGHVHGIHLEGGNYTLSRGCDITQQLGGNLSSSLLRLKQLRHLDLSCNDFGGIQVPEFIGSLRNLRYLNLSVSGFSGIIPPQLGNLSRLHILSLGSFHTYSYEYTHMMNMQWLSSIRLLHHLDMSGVNLSKAIDWFQVINTLSSLTELHLSNCDLMDIHPYVPILNITSLSSLDLSKNNFSSFMPQWIFSITNLVSLDFSACYFHTGNELSKKMPKSIVNFCNLRDINLSFNDFGNISLNYLLEGFLECKSYIGRSSPLEELDVTHSDVFGTIPDFIQQLTSMRRLALNQNRISGRIPRWIGRLSSLEVLDLSNNQLDGNLPHSLGNLSKLERLTFSNNLLDGNLPETLGNLAKLKKLSFSNNLLSGVVTEAHFANLTSLKHLDGQSNNLTLQPRLDNWIPPFRLWDMDLSSWSLGPQFPLWLQSQTHLTRLFISNTGISSAMPVSFWKSFPRLWNIDMSRNNIHGMLLDIPTTVTVLELNSNKFRGKLPKFSNGSLLEILDLSSNFFEGQVDRLLCSDSVKMYTNVLNLGNNHLSGDIPECFDRWQELIYLNLENNHLSGEIPGTLGSLSGLESLNLHGNKLSGRIPASLMNLKDLGILQLGRNELVGSIPKWFGNFSSLRLLNLRYNNFIGNIPYELCYPTYMQILDLAHNDLSGNIPICFNNFSVLSGKEVLVHNTISFGYYPYKEVRVSDSLVMKGREDTYNTILGLVTLLDLSSNNLVGHIPSELTTLRKLKSLNLSRNQFTGRIPEKMGDMKSLETLDVSLNKLSGKLPMSLSSLNFLGSFNVSYNHLTGRVPSSTQLQSFSESSFFGNKLCGSPLTELCIPIKVPNEEVQKEDDVADWGLITSIFVGLVVGFWLVVAPLMVSRAWRIAYFRFLSEFRYMVHDVMCKYGVNMFPKSSKVFS